MFDTPALYNSVNRLFCVQSESTEHFTTRPVFYGDLYFYTLEGIFCTVPLCSVLFLSLCFSSYTMYIVKDKALTQNAPKNNMHVINLTLCSLI